jgi:hypothetical protein
VDVVFDDRLTDTADKAPVIVSAAERLIITWPGITEAELVGYVADVAPLLDPVGVREGYRRARLGIVADQYLSDVEAGDEDATALARAELQFAELHPDVPDAGPLAMLEARTVELPALALAGAPALPPPVDVRAAPPIVSPTDTSPDVLSGPRPRVPADQPLGGDVPAPPSSPRRPMCHERWQDRVLSPWMFFLGFLVVLGCVLPVRMATRPPTAPSVTAPPQPAPGAAGQHRTGTASTTTRGRRAGTSAPGPASTLPASPDASGTPSPAGTSRPAEHSPAGRSAPAGPTPAPAPAPTATSTPSAPAGPTPTASPTQETQPPVETTTPPPSEPPPSPIDIGLCVPGVDIGCT